jgi:uncharacterized protein YprB with RNaseH-like and TPR domain
MLRCTFQHIPGVGEKKERELWGAGCRSWDDFLSGGCVFSGGKVSSLKEPILESVSRLNALDHGFFRQNLPTGLAWRAYSEFREHACFLDIETTGLAPRFSHVTTVCLHSLKGTKTYIRHQNIDKLNDDLEKFKYIVSFNGARFDLPFLASELGTTFHQIHLDLLYPLKKLGYRGGLKAIEHALGISRDTAGVTGFDAVRLWRSYRSGKTVNVAGTNVSGESALDLLVKYNQEDTVNLNYLADFVVSEMKKACGF